MHRPCHYVDNQLFFENTLLRDIAEKHKTPFYLYSEKTIRHNFTTFRDAALEAKIPNPLICFALKANPNPKLIKILASMGCGADVVSGGELKRAIECGIDPQKIVFSGVGKRQEEMEYALNCHPKGIYSFNVESLSELKQLSKISKDLGKKARVALRLNPQVNSKTHKHISTGFKTHKFGLISSEVRDAFRNPLLWEHCDLVGLSMHIGSQLTCLEATKDAIKELGKVQKYAPVELEFIDLGGGLGIDYSPNDREIYSTPLEYMQEIKLALKLNNITTQKIVFEPGRVISATSGVLVTKVLRQKHSGDHHFIIVDGGMNDFVRTSLYEAYHEVLPEIKRDGPTIRVDIVGPICETADCFASGRDVTKIEDQDYLIIGDTGAYGFSMASTYNLRPLPKELTINLEGNID